MLTGRTLTRMTADALPDMTVTTAPPADSAVITPRLFTPTICGALIDQLKTGFVIRLSP